MRKVIPVLLFLVFFSCKNQEKTAPVATKDATSKTPEQLGKEIFEGKGNCIACHQPKQMVVGPSIEEIAKIYKDKNASIISFLKENSAPLVDPEKYEIMKTNLTITKAMSDEELNALEAYIYSNLK